MKRCSKCGKEYPATPEYFYRRRATSSGLYPACKKCMSEEAKKRYMSMPREPKKWTKADCEYLTKRYRELTDCLEVDKIKIISKEMDRTMRSVQNKIYHLNLHNENKPKIESIQKEKVKQNYKIGDRVKVKKTHPHGNELKTITGTITGIYENFILVDTGRIKETFSYIDMAIGDIRVKEANKV